MRSTRSDYGRVARRAARHQHWDSHTTPLRGRAGRHQVLGRCLPATRSRFVLPRPRRFARAGARSARRGCARQPTHPSYPSLSIRRAPRRLRAPPTRWGAGPRRVHSYCPQPRTGVADACSDRPASTPGVEAWTHWSSVVLGAQMSTPGSPPDPGLARGPRGAPPLPRSHVDEWGRSGTPAGTPVDSRAPCRAPSRLPLRDTPALNRAYYRVLPRPGPARVSVGSPIQGPWGTVAPRRVLPGNGVRRQGSPHRASSDSPATSPTEWAPRRGGDSWSRCLGWQDAERLVRSSVLS